MRNWLTLLTLLAASCAAWGQPTTITRASIPTSAQLDALNLKLGWAITVPIEGPRDGIATIQVLPVPHPVKANTETAVLVVQMRSGTITMYDAETGRKYWSRRPVPAYPVTVPEVAYDPRGYLIVIRDLNLYRFELFPSVAVASDATDESASKLVTLPSMPTTPPVVVVGDPAKKEEGVIVLCFNGNRLMVYGQAYEIYRLKRDTTELKWKVRYDQESTSIFKPGDNKSPSLVAVDSVFGPDYGMNKRAGREPAPKTASLVTIRNLSRPDEFGSDLGSTPSLTTVHNLSKLGEMSLRNMREPPIEGESRRGDLLDFRLQQAPGLLHVFIPDRTTRGQSGFVTKVVLVGGDREIQIDLISEKIGLIPERKIGRDLLRADLSAPVAFRGNTLYVPTMDGTVYSVDGEFGLVAWTSAIQHIPYQRPAVVAPHLFVCSRQGKLFRLNLDDGSLPREGSFAADGSFPAIAARQFLAASDRYVYAVDQQGNLAVLDRRRGTLQGRVSISGFTTTYLNDVTDRVFLGANDGKLICLHDKSAPTQKLYRSAAQVMPPGGKADTPMDPAKPVEKPPTPPKEKE